MYSIQKEIVKKEKQKMTKFRVYQIHLTEEEYSLVNAKGHGACKKHMFKIDMPIARTDEKLLALVLGAESCGFYKLACSIEADDLNGVFRTGNIGPEEDIKRHPKNPMSSVSVGDVIVDTSTDKRFVVAPQGFKEVPALESSLAKLLADKYLEGRIPAPSSYLEIAYQNNLEMR